MAEAATAGAEAHWSRRYAAHYTFRVALVNAWPAIDGMLARLAASDENADRLAGMALRLEAEKADLLARLAAAEAAPFHCPAIVRHGPGHQSSTRCARETPHDINGEHWAPDPMCPGFEWEGPKG